MRIKHQGSAVPVSGAPSEERKPQKNTKLPLTFKAFGSLAVARNMKNHKMKVSLRNVPQHITHVTLIFLTCFRKIMESDNKNCP